LAAATLLSKLPAADTNAPLLMLVPLDVDDMND
jgi:hypothetical protein